MPDEIGNQKIGGMSVDSLLKTMKRIVERETTPLYRKVAALEVENRNLRARISAKESTGGGNRYQPVRK